MPRQNIMQTYKELMMIKYPPNFVKHKPSIQPDPNVVAYTNKYGRREGLLYNNRIHFTNSGDGKIVHTGLAPKEQYDINRDWILKNFPK